MANMSLSGGSGLPSREQQKAKNDRIRAKNKAVEAYLSADAAYEANPNPATKTARNKAAAEMTKLERG